jgi:hypothetical protein
VLLPLCLCTLSEFRVILVDQFPVDTDELLDR